MESTPNKPANEPGLYTDPESGRELRALVEPQADALVKMGWIRAEEAEIVVKPEASLNELRAKAKDLGLSGGGTKDELAERIAEA